ncbi:ketoacyl-ACP synthase III [Desulfovibrio sp. OttesenSCG-928-F07]|nr:ketoacyl-ACP synthase III [Desulfovibrio sp. OttesenSCG-928-F07]
MALTAYIKGLGYYVPERIVDNNELSTMVETSDEWIRTRTGIEQRHVVAPGQTCSDLIVEAAKKAFNASGIKPEEITHIINATVSGDDAFPSTATRVQAKLGITGMAFDISAACSGFIYGLQIARGFLAIQPNAKILVTAAEVLSRRVNWKDRTTCVLFGDGSGAAILTADPAAPANGASLMTNAVIEEVMCDADGRTGDLLYCNGGCSSFPYKLGDVVGPENFIQMNGREVFKHAVRTMSAISRQLMEKRGYTIDDFDLVVPHQANIRIIQAVADRLNVPAEKLFVNVNRYGNTSAASIPLAMAEALELGVIKPGMRVLFTTFGAGLTWGGAIVKF